jgi:LuxR family maltose regulon positive regulatory protein
VGHQRSSRRSANSAVASLVRENAAAASGWVAGLQLTAALTLACRQGYVRVFADEGPPMRALLARLVAAQRTEEPAARELEVLGLLAAGRSNQEIAEKLVVTLDTVKKHVGHVLDKLGAGNRTEVVARARQLGLLR